jgi:hypothetical protein
MVMSSATRTTAIASTVKAPSHAEFPPVHASHRFSTSVKPSAGTNDLERSVGALPLDLTLVTIRCRVGPAAGCPNGVGPAAASPNGVQTRVQTHLTRRAATSAWGLQYLLARGVISDTYVSLRIEQELATILTRRSGQRLRMAHNSWLCLVAQRD